MLCEGQKRLNGWFAGGEKGMHLIHGGKPDSELDLRFLNDQIPCGGEDSVVYFINFTIPSPARPIHLINAVADDKGLMGSWNPNKATDYRDLALNKAQGVHGAKLQYAASPFPDRKFYQWESFSNDIDADEVWTSASTWGNKVLKTLDTKPEDSGMLGMSPPKEADICSTSWHAKTVPGGVYVQMSASINIQPPFGVSPAWVTEMTWGKFVDSMKATIARAKDLATKPVASLWKPDVALTSPPVGPFAPSEDCTLLAAAASRALGGGPNLAEEGLPDFSTLGDRIKLRSAQRSAGTMLQNSTQPAPLSKGESLALEEATLPGPGAGGAPPDAAAGNTLSPIVPFLAGGALVLLAGLVVVVKTKFSVSDARTARDGCSYDQSDVDGSGSSEDDQTYPLHSPRDSRADKS
jgi:hypothetical protein